MLFEHSMVKPTKVGNGEQIFRYVPYLVSNNLDKICNLINGLQQAALISFDCLASQIKV